LAFETQSGDHEFVRETRVIGAFQESGTERRMDVDGCADDSLRDVFVQHEDMTFVSSVSSVVMNLDKQLTLQR
jgi:hypothetical protein